MSATKKMMYINRNAPYGTVYALEGLDVSMAFIGDGIYQILKGQDTSDSDMKNFSPTYNALGDYEVTKLYVEQESLDERGLSVDDLMPLVYEDEDDDWAEKPSIIVLSRADLAVEMAGQDVLFNF